jgi:methylenetetrahydrofolate dehydrogenase (NADP+)/methenyltetrahydrofolate cyclohydrolase
MTHSQGAAPARVIDGVAAAREIIARLKERVGTLARSGIRPGLAAVQVGENPASMIYLRNKVRACDEAGVHSELHILPADCPRGEVIATLDRLNRDARLHGILLQLPLPPHLEAERIQQSIAPEKDVDGLTWASLGALLAGQPSFEPCTPAGVMVLLERAGIALDGRHAVVVGRSAIVGKPMALMLMARGATVTICHSRTRGLADHTLRADVLVAAAGRPRFITREMVKPGAAVIDVGINRLPDGKLAGDVDYAGVSQVAGWLTPVPGGVGPMTVAMVINNTVRAAERRLSPPGAGRAQQ